MSRRTYNLAIEFDIVQGDDWSRTVELRDINGDAIDVSGYGWAAEARQGDETLTITVDDSDAANGNIDLSLTNEQTTDCTGTWAWDTQWTDLDDKVRTVLGGRLHFLDDITDG